MKKPHKPMIIVRVTEEEKRKFKSFCAVRGVTMQEFLHRFITRPIDQSREGAE